VKSIRTIHGVFSSYHEKKAFGSHVVEGITMNTVEIFLGVLEDPIKRKMHPESGPPVLMTA
jgi:predicted DNA-binding protein with PD1-like motif